VKQFACGAVMPGCDARFEARTEEELLRQIGQHAHEAHGLDEVPTELVDQVRANIIELGGGPTGSRGVAAA
jgi:predicted small metal-binding protein